MSKRIDQLFADLEKMDPSLSQALRDVRAGKSSPAAVKTISRELYTDLLIPKLGNRRAYRDHISRHANDGYHVHVDMNDFGQVNKQHGEDEGDRALQTFGNTASEVSRSFGGKAYRDAGDQFKFWFHRPEQAHGFARELRSRLEKLPKAGGTHNISAAMGIGHNPEHAQNALKMAKDQLGPTDATGKRQNHHQMGGAPTVVHSALSAQAPNGWKAPAGEAPAKKSTESLAPAGLKFHNPLKL